MKDINAACAVLLALFLTLSHSLFASPAPATAAEDNYFAITLQADRPYYYGTEFQVNAVASNWSNRILSGLRAEDNVENSLWVFPYVARLDGQLVTRIGTSNGTSGDCATPIAFGQTYQVVIRGIWNGGNRIDYSYTLSPTAAAGDNDWISCGFHTVSGTPSLEYLYKSQASDAEYNGEIGQAIVSTTYSRVVTSPANQAPVAAFTSLETGLDVNFDASGSTDPDGSIANYAWEFGDGNTGSGVTPTHRYGAAGTYTVSLVVTDNQGLSSVAVARQLTVSAPNAPPALSAIGDLAVTEDDRRVFRLRASDTDDGDRLAFSLSGSVPAFVRLVDDQDGSARLIVTAAAGDAGTYAGLTVTVTDGAREARETFSLVVNAAPALQFSRPSLALSSVIGLTPTEVTVTLGVNDGGAPSVTLSDDPDASEWLQIPASAGLGNLTFRLKPTAAPGVYNTVIIASADGYASAELPVTATVVTPPVSSDVPRITSVNPANGTTGVSTTTSISANELDLPNGENGVFGVDNATITSETVKLLKLPSLTEVPVTTNGTGGGDAINLTPLFPLEPSTTYRFVVNGVRDLTGARFERFVSTFTTSTGNTGGSGNLDNVAFTNGGNVATGGRYTSLAVGPDGKLYGLRIDGTIDRWSIATDGSLTGQTTITTLTDAYGSRSAIGMTFAPSATASNLIVYVSHCTGVLSNAPAWDGKISELSGPALANEQLMVTNLPRSRRDHLTNSIAFRDGEPQVLYFNQGSNTAGGAPDNSWGNRLERLLSAATLRLDLGKLPRSSWPLNAKTTMNVAAINVADTDSPTLGSGTGTYTEDGQTYPDDGTYNPYYSEAPLTLFATGVRNAFDLVWHSNGQLYVPTNGTAGGSNTPASIDGTRRADGGFYDYADGNFPTVPLTRANNTQRDWLFRVDPTSGIGYYGHPNPLRGEFVLNRGPLDVNNYPASVTPDINYRGAAYDFEFNKSPNGVIEYRSNAENGNLRGALLVCRYSGGSDIIALVPGGANGDIVTAKVGIPGFSGFQDPLDIVEDPSTGNLYVSDFGTSTIVLLQPSDQATPRPFLAVTPQKIVTDAVVGTTEPITVFISNSGNAALEGATATLSGASADQFVLDATSLPAELGVSATASLVVTFAPTTAGPKSATLTITGTNSEPTTVALSGLGKLGTGGNQEPSLQQIFATYGLEVAVGDLDPATATIELPDGRSYNDLLGDEVSIQKFQRATDGPVTLELLSVFGPEDSNPVAGFGWYPAEDPSLINEVLTIRNRPAGNGQTLTPAVTGSLNFNPGTRNFGVYSRWPFFGNRTVFGQDEANTFSGAIPHHVRVYEVPNEDNAYIVAFEEHTSGFDYQDLVLIMRNAAPAGAPVLVASPNELVFETTVNNDGNRTQTRTLTVTNDGRTDLIVSGVALSGPFADQFSFTGPEEVVIAPASAQTYQITYAPTRDDIALGYQRAGLRFISNSSNAPTTTVGLYGLKKAGYEDEKEPPLQDVVRTLGYDINVGWTTLAHTMSATAQGEEILTSFFEAAGTGPVGLTAVARYSPARVLPFGWYTVDNGAANRRRVGVQTGSIENAQRLYPTLSEGTTQFSAAGQTFGIYVDLGDRIDQTEDGRNQGGTHRTRIYAAKDRTGKTVANQYLIAFEEAANGDYQDNVFLLTNARPAGAGAQVLSFFPERVAIEVAGDRVSSNLTSSQVTFTGAGAPGALQLASDQDWVILPAAATAGTPIDFAVNAFGLTDGVYRATITASAPGYQSASLLLTATVRNGYVFSQKINFQDHRFTPPVGYRADVGDPYGIREDGLTYGWIDGVTGAPVGNLQGARGAARGITDNSTDEYKLIYSLNQFDQVNINPRIPRDWEIEVPNGTYEVEIAAGDSKLFNSRHYVNVEGVRLIEDFQPTAEDFYRVARGTVEVFDGRLTLDDEGAGFNYNSKIIYVSLTRIDAPRRTPEVLATISGSATATEGSYRGAVSISLEANDRSQSGGIRALQYSIDGGDFVDYAAPFSLSPTGNREVTDYVVIARAVDRNNNVGTRELDLALLRASGALLRVENMTKLPGSNRGFPAEDYFAFSRSDAIRTRNGQIDLFHDSNVMRLHNDGTAPLLITGLSTQNPANFTVSGLPIPAGGLSVPAGGFVDATLTFVTTEQEVRKQVVKGQVAIASNADNAASIEVILSGGYQRFSDGNNEITNQQIFETFGFTTEMARVNGNYVVYPTSDYPTDAAVNAGEEGDLILSPFFEQADPSQPVRMIQLATYQGNRPSSSQLRGTDDRTIGGVNYSHGNAYYQSILPKTNNTSSVIAGRSVNTINVPFQARVAGYRTSGGNSRNGLKDQVLGARVYKVKDHLGKIIANEYIIIHDFVGNGCDNGGGNCDWQDNVAYLVNARPLERPSAQSIANRTVVPGQRLNYDVSGSFDRGYAGNDFTYSAVYGNGEALPSWIALDAATGTFSLQTPLTATRSVRNIRVTATDNNGLTVASTFTLTIDVSGQDCTVDANADGRPKVIFCEGGSVRLSGFSATGIYKWTGPDGFTSRAPSPIVSAAGVYTLTTEIVSYGSCPGSSQVTVSQDLSGAPAVSIQSSTRTLTCALRTIQLRATTPVANPDYVWYSGNRVIGAGSTQNVSATGTYRLVMTTADGCVATRNVTIDEDLSPVSAGNGGSVTVCSSDGFQDLFTLLSGLGGNPEAGGSWTLLGRSVGDRFDPADFTSATFTYTVGGGVAGCQNSSSQLTVLTRATATYYRDADDDGFGDAGEPLVSCRAPAGYVSNDGDCNDDDATVHPGAIESCDGKDNDCDGDTDEGDACTVSTAAIRINTGGPRTTFGGQVFAADRNFLDGNDYENTSPDLPTLYETERTAGSPFLLRYNVPVPAGAYTVRLHFAEIYWGATGGAAAAGGSGRRVFDILLEGQLVADNFDINAEVGAMVATVKQYNITVTDGTLNLRLDANAATGGVNQPKISGIEIIPAGATGPNGDPVAVARATPASGSAPLSVNLDGTDSYDTDGGIVAYDWRWNGGTATGPSARVDFTEGQYAITLTVTDNLGATATDNVNVTVTGTIVDFDGDGVEDAVDNCPTVPNADQRLPRFYADQDGDGFGDPAISVVACVAPDGYVRNRRDNCPLFASTDLTDTDGDGTGDSCDTDDDDDGVADDDDCAPLDPSQGGPRLYYADSDGDGFGDPALATLSCTPVAGYVLDNTDNCPATANPDQTDTDGNGRGDACEGAANATRAYWLEAECGLVGSTFSEKVSGDASGGRFVDAEGQLSLSAAPADVAANRLRFIVDKAAPGNYYLYARILARNSTSDSYWVRVNGGEWIKWSGGITTGTQFFWNEFPQTLPFAAGINTVDVAWREGAARLDKLHLNLSENLPTGIGMEATNCGTGVNQPPVAVATASVTAGLAPLTTELNGEGSSDPDGRLVAYAWNWNGGSATGARATATFPAGRYAVTLTVIDDLGSTATTTLDIRALDGDADSDSDGIPDAVDNCPTVANPGQVIPTFYADLDQDGVGDSNQSVTACQAPADYVTTSGDNCPAVANPDQLDSDGDGIGDVCDDDNDNDGVANADDCAPLDATIGRSRRFYFDGDDDGFGDPNRSVLACTAPTGYVTDRTDNCPFEANPDQTDSDGNGTGDACEGIVYTRSSFWLEAECGIVGSIWRTLDDVNAAEGKYVAAPGETSTANPPTDTDANLVRFLIQDAEPGNYRLFARIQASDGLSDSYWLRVNGQAWIRWSGGIQRGADYHWNQLREQLALTSGVNVIDFAFREGDTRLDKLHLSTVDQAPVGLGAPATNCGERANLAPIARASTSPARGAAPLSVTLDGRASSDTDGTVTDYRWEWNGGTATGSLASAVFPVGEYAVTLTVTDDAGATATETVTVSALNASVDTDSDGVPDALDNCPTLANADQVLPRFYADFDGDGLGDPADFQDACEQPADFVANDVDKCPSVFSPENEDLDGDGIGDACDRVVGDDVRISLEAECGDLGAGWRLTDGAGASNGRYLAYVGAQDFALPVAEAPAKVATLRFDVPTDGTYFAFLRVDMPNAQRNSLWIRVDDGPWIKFWKDSSGNQLLTTGFEWRKLADDGQAISLDLTAGAHRLVIHNREAASLVDKVLITTIDEQPTGTGLAATNCGGSTAVTSPATSATVVSGSVATEAAPLAAELYPNPAVERFTLSLTGGQPGKVLVVITDMTGRTVKSLTVEQGPEGLLAPIDIDGLPAGAYRVRLLQADRQLNLPLVKLRR